MDRLAKINISDFFLIPNLLSFVRILITIPLGYYLAINNNESILICAILLIAAGLTDFLDGLTARVLNQKSLLGLYLDPLADKFMAIILIIELVFTRSFPVWLAVAVIIRD
ncbi:MAG: CDP-alcohol phosphatidyltransferase family protein, partial [Candidatus Zixiibacteriota bacterium]